MVITAMNDPWDVKSVRQSNQYLSCMKINGVALLPPVLSKECYVEMQYYKLLAKEVEKRIQTLKPLIVDSDSESCEDKTDAPELPESDQSYDISPEEMKENKDYAIHTKTEKCLEDCFTEKIQHFSNTYDNITSNFSIDTDSASSKLSSKFVIDLSLSINETGRHLIDSINTSNTVDIPERDYDYPKREQKELLMDIEKNCKAADKVNFNINIKKDLPIDPMNFGQEGPSSLSCKSFTGSLNNIHMDSAKEVQEIPLTRQRSYTVLIPSPMLLAHLEVQSINTGMDITSISMSESMSNISNSNKKRRSWDLETAKVKWSSMALELKEKNIANNNKTVNPKSVPVKPTTKKTPQVILQRPRSLAQDKVKHSPPKVTIKSEPIQKPRKGISPVRISTPQSTGKSVVCPKSAQKKKEDVETSKQNDVSESEDPATRVRELYDKIQKQQFVQMANLVEKQKKEQQLLQQVFEEQNNLLFTQLKTICPKSPNDVKEVCKNQNNEISSRGPVSLSQLISQKQPEHPSHNSPVLSTLTDTNNYINYCDDVLKKSRFITGSMKKTETKIIDKRQSPQQLEGSKTRSHSPSHRNTPTSRKLTYERTNSVCSDRDNDQILTDRTNDTMADILNVTFPSDYSDECPPYLHKTIINNCGSDSVSPVSAPTMAASCRSASRPNLSLEQTKQISINSSICSRMFNSNLSRTPTAQERAAATKIVSLARGYLVRRLLRSERVQATVQTIKDALLCALQLHTERGGIRGADVDLHRRLIQQITAACYTLHDTFITSSPSERCSLIAADRSRRRSIAARLPTPTRHRPTDVMSQSHSGAFPPRVKRPPASIMSQSNHETFSSDKIVRRYMPSPRRRPWR